MQGVRVLDKRGNELDIKDASRYIQLKDIKVNISSMYYGSRTLMMSLDSTAPIARGDDGTLTFSGTGMPKFGFERYRCVSPDSSMSFTLDYAKKASASQTSPVTDSMEGIKVGGDYYAMYGGFMLSVNGLKDATGITIDYTTVFDYEQFAKDHPEGTYIVATGSHVVCVQDGDYYDTWDSGHDVPSYFFYMEDDKR